MKVIGSNRVGRRTLNLLGRSDRASRRTLNLLGRSNRLGRRLTLNERNWIQLSKPTDPKLGRPIHSVAPPLRLAVRTSSLRLGSPSPTPETCGADFVGVIGVDVADSGEARCRLRRSDWGRRRRRCSIQCSGLRPLHWISFCNLEVRSGG